MRKKGKGSAHRCILRGALLLILLCAVVIAMIPYGMERLLLYFPVRKIRANPGDLGLRSEDVWLATSDNVKLHGWFVPCEGAKRTILLLHGNAGNIGHRVEWIGRLHGLGVHVFIVDYRGFGCSEGAPFEEGLYRDAAAAWDWWRREREPRGEQLVLLGESLGGAVAVNLASRKTPAALILQSTFTSGRDMARWMFPIGMLRPLINVRFDSASRIASVRCPTLVIHGTEDKIVPFRLGKRLYDLAPPPKDFFAVTGAGHNDLVATAGGAYEARLLAFLSAIP